MTKAELKAEIDRLKNQLATYRSDLKVLKEKISVLEDFAGRCNQRITDFDTSITKRKNRNLKFESLAGTVKFAAKYFEKMQAILTGTDYTNVVGSIEDLQTSIGNQRKTINNNIIDLEDKIPPLEKRISELQYEFDNYPEEVKNEQSK